MKLTDFTEKIIGILVLIVGALLFTFENFNENKE